MRVLAVAVASLLALGACGDATSEPGGDGRIRVVASFYPLAEIASRVGGDAAVVENLTQAGVEPHDLELTAEQVDAIEDASLVLYLGSDFQPAVERAAIKRADGALDVLGAVAGAETGDAADPDPHFWLDPREMAEAVAAVAAAMTEVAAAADKAGIATRARVLTGELVALDAEIERGLASCARRDLVTAHDAFTYLARRYDLREHPIAGVSPEGEPDPRRLAELADLVERTGTTTVFSEELLPPDVAETLARETGAVVRVLNPIEGLTGAQRRAGATYFSLMRDNLDALRTALGCR